MASNFSLFLICALFVVVQSRGSLESPLLQKLRERRSPDISLGDSDEKSWFDNLKDKTVDALNKAKETVKDGFEATGDKLSEIGKKIQESDAYEKVSQGVNDAKEKLKTVGENIKESDAYKGAKTSINSAADAIKEKFDD